MKLIESLAEMQDLQYPAGSKIGFVPTMGYLHEGHLSLVQCAKAENDISVVSIFVNPAQFGPTEDLQSYPRDLKRDLELLEAMHVDYVFFPTPQMMYPAGYRSWVEVQGLSDILCGASRPGHFRGVCTVVLKLIHLVRPDSMYMGEKDFQQLCILRTMAQDLNSRVRIVGCPIVRERDGLAKSSRNVYLSAEEHDIALSLSQALLQARAMKGAGTLEARELISAAKGMLQKAGARIDYVHIVDSRTLQDQTWLDEHSRMLIAAWVGKTRLIDNMALI